MQWLASSLSQLRHVESASSARKLAHSRNSSQANAPHARRWTLITAIQTPNLIAASDPTSSVYLPLTSETAIPFDKSLESFRDLAEKSLLTLYLDVRFGIIHQLSRALRPIDPEVPEDPQLPDAHASSATIATETPSLNSGLYPFVLPSPPTSASPRILELNNDLISFDANISAYLGLKERKFILTGLGTLVDRYLIVGADYILVMNREGAERMRVDAMVMQQVLRGLGVSAPKSSQPPTKDEEKKSNGNTVGLGISETANSNNSPSSQDETHDDGMLVASSRYYDLFLQGPDAIMKSVKDRKEAETTTTAAAAAAAAATTSPPPSKETSFTYDELRTLIELCFSATIKGDDREESIRARRKMDDLLLQLGEVMWDS